MSKNIALLFVSIVTAICTAEFSQANTISPNGYNVPGASPGTGNISHDGGSPRGGFMTLNYDSAAECSDDCRDHCDEAGIEGYQSFFAPIRGTCWCDCVE